MAFPPAVMDASATRDRKSTRLNSSHVEISYAVFCLKKKRTWPSMKSFLTSSPPFSVPLCLCGDRSHERTISYGGRVSGALDCFFFNDTATTEIYTLSLHDALPI